MFSNSEYKERLKKVHPEYVQTTPKGGEKWKEARVFWTVIYKDNLKDDIEKCCDNFSSPCLLSPYHDKDSNDDGEIKKGHWHFMTKYGSKKNPYQFYVDLVSAFGEDAFSTIEIVGDTGKCVRYLIHLDETDPHKFHYDIDSIKSFGGFEFKKYLFENVGDTVDNVQVLMNIIDENNILFFNKLARFLQENDPLLFASLIKDRECKAFVMNYLKGKEHDYFYEGKVEKGYTVTTFKDGKEVKTDKYQFNRGIKIG